MGYDVASTSSSNRKPAGRVTAGNRLVTGHMGILFSVNTANPVVTVPARGRAEVPQ